MHALNWRNPATLDKDTVWGLVMRLKKIYSRWRGSGFAQLTITPRHCRLQAGFEPTTVEYESVDCNQL